MIVETIFFHCLRYFSRSSSSWLVETHFSVQKKKYYFLPRTFFPARGNHYLNYREAYLKLYHYCFLLVETDFLSTWFYLEIFFCYWEFNFWKITLFSLVETDFLASGNHLFFPFSDYPATDSFIFPSNGNVFVNNFCILVSQSEFLARVIHYFIYFTDIGNVFLKQILHSG